MSKTEIVVIVLAMAADSFATSWFTGALHKKLSVKLDISLPLMFTAGRTMMLSLGIGAGWYAASLIPDYSFLIGLSLLLVIGIKPVIEALKFNPEEKVILVDDSRTMLLLSLAVSISSFFAGIGLGMAGSGLLVPVIVTAISVLVFSSAGIKAGETFGYKPIVRFSGLITGIVILIIWFKFLIFGIN